MHTSANHGCINLVRILLDDDRIDPSVALPARNNNAGMEFLHSRADPANNNKALRRAVRAEKWIQSQLLMEDPRVDPSIKE